MKTKLLVLMSVLALSPVMADQGASPATPPSQPTCVENTKWVSDKLTSALGDLVTKSVALAGDAKDFVAEQLPDVVQQLLKWKMAESIAQTLMGLTFILIAVVITKKVVAYGNKVKWSGYDHEEIIPLSIVGGFVVLGLTIAGMLNMSLTWLQIWIAPKVYLIEYARSMVK